MKKNLNCCVTVSIKIALYIILLKCLAWFISGQYQLNYKQNYSFCLPILIYM